MVANSSISRRGFRAEDVAALKNSPAFDEEWYRSAYPDVAISGLDPAEHFLTIGSRIGRSPLPVEGAFVAQNTGRPVLGAPMSSAASSTLMTLSQRGMPRPPLNLATERQVHFDIKDERFWELVSQVFDYTELSIAALYNLYSATLYVLETGIAGDFVECGVHMGGSVMLMAHLLLEQGADRRLLALDTFSGFVRRSSDLDVDLRSGEQACLIEDEPADYAGPSIENMTSVGYKGLRVVEGDVLETIPTMNVDRVALLRLDTDTYDTTKFELEQLYDRVSVGGVIIVDDYGYTVGCKKAVDDFIADKQILLHRINTNVRSFVKPGR